MPRLTTVRTALVLSVCIAASASEGQTFTTLATFDGANGESPYYGSLAEDANGNFYGTTLSGGDASTSCSNGQGYDCGTIFRITPDGALTTIYTFCSAFDCNDGISPDAGLILGANGNFYGTTSFGGADFTGGTVFEITPTGTLTTLYNFCAQLNCTDGSYPYSQLVQSSNGTIYGTTLDGGANNQGTVFQITASGTFSVLYSFCSKTNCADGSLPFAALTVGSNGELYGTTEYGGAANAGTVFAITTSGKLTTLHSFSFADGAYPFSAVAQSSNGIFYGTTSAGGLRDAGTVFEMSANGKLKTIYNFCQSNGCADGATPQAALTKGGNGGFYGTTFAGGSHSRGTVFEVSASGKLKTLYSFCSKVNCEDGANPYSGVAEASDGTLYGTTFNGGLLSCSSPYGCGMVFSLVP
ncbi:MAG TPA: choice-of-anchor tandem repeat GloVer-containing protein [Candidatus Binatia bacterium]|nr:choice-of-anchor tandem repeat GloVer-containing protein [Candidatus Binatia bacterium]